MKTSNYWREEDFLPIKNLTPNLLISFLRRRLKRMQEYRNAMNKRYQKAERIAPRQHIAEAQAAVIHQQLNELKVRFELLANVNHADAEYLKEEKRKPKDKFAGRNKQNTQTELFR